MHTAPYFTVFGLMTILYGWRVIQMRLEKKIAFGDGGLEILQRRMRVFGNFTEYVPMGLILLIALEFVQAPPLYMHVSGTLFLIGRMMHATALQKGSDTGKLRFTGMALTFVGLFLSSIGILIWSFAGPAA